MDIKKLINNIWLNYHPASKLLTLDVLCDNDTAFIENCNFALDLNDKEDLKDFWNLLEFLKHNETDFEVDNAYSTLLLNREGQNIALYHEASDDNNKVVSYLEYEDSNELHKVIKKIAKGLFL